MLLLEDDLIKAGYLSRKNKRRGRRGYIVLSSLIFVIFLIVFYVSKSLWSFSLLLPYVFSIFRIFKARYYTLEGREKLKQLKSLKIALQSPEDFFSQQMKWINTRDLAPLILPYAISFNLVETFLDHLDDDSLSRLGILDLLKAQVNFGNISENVIDEEWLFTKTELFTYVLFICCKYSIR